MSNSYQRTSDVNNQVSSKTGLPPGALVYIGSDRSNDVHLSRTRFDTEKIEQLECDNLEQCFDGLPKGAVQWIDVDGIHEPAVVQAIGTHFNIHPLLQEDILNSKHRPNFQAFDNCVFITLKMLSVHADDGVMQSEQVSLVLTENTIISFQERPGDVFGDLRKRISNPQSLLRKKGADYLMYRLIDTIVDHYFAVAEHFTEQTDLIEQEVLSESDTDAWKRIQELKREVMRFRRSTIPLREAIGAMTKDPTKLIAESTSHYLKDVYEHVIQVNESVEGLRDLLGSVMDLYLSGVSNRMNKVMQVLTIISTIFIPLTFIAGIYGMNFQHMPELHYEYGYQVILGIMVLIFIAMLIYFKRKKWI